MVSNDSGTRVNNLGYATSSHDSGM